MGVPPIIKRRSYGFYGGVIFLWIIFQSCSTTIVDITEAPVESYSGNVLSLQQVKDAIFEAGRSKKWAMEEKNPGEIIGKFKTGRYSVKVAIPYTTKTYSILYKDSKGLKASGRKIHRKYKSIINELQNAIFTGITLAHHRSAQADRQEIPAQTPPPPKAPPTIEVQDSPKQEGPSMDEFADWLRQTEQEGDNSTDTSSAYSK